jgi:hypothetical protein
MSLQELFSKEQPPKQVHIGTQFGVTGGSGRDFQGFSSTVRAFVCLRLTFSGSLITQRSVVQIHPPQPNLSFSSECHEFPVNLIGFTCFGVLPATVSILESAIIRQLEKHNTTLESSTVGPNGTGPGLWFLASSIPLTGQPESASSN